MCGRFTAKFTWQQIHMHLSCFIAGLMAEAAERYPLLCLPNYNLSPTDHVPAVRMMDRGPELVGFRWGLIPTNREGEEWRNFAALVTPLCHRENAARQITVVRFILGW